MTIKKICDICNMEIFGELLSARYTMKGFTQGKNHVTTIDVCEKCAPDKVSCELANKRLKYIKKPLGNLNK